MRQERRRIVFTGQVQGVGFRMTTVHLAKGVDIGGTVRNLPDGSVELHAWGPAKALDQLVERIREHFGSFVRSMDQQIIADGNAAADEAHERGIRVIS